MRRVLGGGEGDFSAESVTRSYNNVLREELGKELFDVRECRENMVNVAREEACTTLQWQLVENFSTNTSQKMAAHENSRGKTENYLQAVLPSKLQNLCNERDALGAGVITVLSFTFDDLDGGGIRGHVFGTCRFRVGQ